MRAKTITTLVSGLVVALGINAAIAQTAPAVGADLHHYLGRTNNSSYWIAHGSVKDLGLGKRGATLLQNTMIEVSFTNGITGTVRSIANELEVDCHRGTYVDLTERHFAEEFARGTQMFESTLDGLSLLHPEQHRPKVGTVFYSIVNEVCTFRVGVGKA